MSSKDNAKAADKFAQEHPGELPSSYFANGDDYQDMRAGWNDQGSVGCFTGPISGVVVILVLILILVL